jgi:hypothetical protein
MIFHSKKIDLPRLGMQKLANHPTNRTPSFQPHYASQVTIEVEKFQFSMHAFVFIITTDIGRLTDIKLFIDDDSMSTGVGYVIILYNSDWNHGFEPYIFTIF